MDVDLDRTLLLSHATPNPNGHRLFRATVVALASFIVLLLASPSASAATLNVSGGQLLGASGVIVDGSSYNVEFLDGTCIALYSGCDSIGDFTFQTETAALLASQALLDQVFLDDTGLFDTDPELTNGCESVGLCRAFVPYGIEAGDSVLTSFTYNYWADGGRVDKVGLVSVVDAEDLSASTASVYAVWTPVPEPGTAALMGLGLLGLSVRKRREG